MSVISGDFRYFKNQTRLKYDQVMTKIGKLGSKF
jgi:hypothetical protein